MQQDLKYEPDLVLRMVEPGSSKKHPKAKVLKSRYAIFEQDETYEFTPKICRQLTDYLNDGADAGELLEQQRQDYVKGIKEYLDANADQVPIWKTIKTQDGFKETPLEDMPLEALRSAFSRLNI